MTDAERAPVLMIGLDAAEYSLIQKWIEDGSLPNLAKLAGQGVSGRLDSTANWLVGSPWPSFYTSSLPSDHGLYHYLQWRPQEMKHDRPAREWLPLNPFWRRAARAGRQVIAFDVPLTYAPEDYPGIEVSGWATHELLQDPASQPPGLLAEIEREHGKPPFDAEESRLLNHAEVISVRDQCIETTKLVSEVCIDLMKRNPWDLFLVCFAATHRAGHQLWDETNLSEKLQASQRADFSDAIRQVYIAIDSAIGEMVEQAGEGATTLVFSLHGMGVNVSRAEILRDMLESVLRDAAPDDDGTAQRTKPVDRLRALVPASVRARVKNRLPRVVQDWLTLFWRTNSIDWGKTAAFSAFSDLDGYIRVNLKGRERDGIVEPGAEFDALLDRIEAGLRSFVDADTGEPVVAGTIRASELFGADAEIAETIPDMMIRWAPSSASIHSGITSPEFGNVAWPTPGKHPQSRSGNHRPDGFLIASGDAVEPDTPLDSAHIIDVAPSVFALLGLDQPSDFCGEPLFKHAQEDALAKH